MKQKTKKILLTVFAVLMLVSVMSVTAFAAEGDVAGAVEDTWIAARGQIKSVVNKVIFPIIDLVLAVLFFVKVSTAYLDYRKHGQFEWTAPAILLATLVFSIFGKFLECKQHRTNGMGFSPLPHFLKGGMRDCLTGYQTSSAESAMPSAPRCPAYGKPYREASGACS